MKQCENTAEFNSTEKYGNTQDGGKGNAAILASVCFILVFALAGCQTLKNMAVEVGEVVAGVDRDPEVTSDAESIVAGVEAAKPFLPFPVRESIAAILSGLAVYTVASKKKKEGVSSSF